MAVHGFAERAVAVLEDGVPLVDWRAARFAHEPIAVWRGNRYGAVAFCRVSDGAIAHAVTLHRSAGPGRWAAATGFLTSSAPASGLARVGTQWRGDPFLWDAYIADIGIRVIYGAVSRTVQALRVDQGSGRSLIGISNSHAFVIGFEHPGFAVITPVDNAGATVSDVFGRSVARTITGSGPVDWTT